MRVKFSLCVGDEGRTAIVDIQDLEKESDYQQEKTLQSFWLHWAFQFGGYEILEDEKE